MDEQPECSHTLHVEEIKNDQLESQKDQLTEKEQNLPEEPNPPEIPEIPTVLTKDHPVSSEMVMAPKTLAIAAASVIERTINFKEQPTFSKAQPKFFGDQPIFAKAPTIFSEDQPSHSRDQPSHSKDQPDQSMDQPTSSKSQTRDKPAVASLTKIYIDTAKDESASSRELIVESKNQIDSKKVVSLSNEEKALILKKYATAASSCCNINKEYFLSNNAPLKINSPAQISNENGPHSQLPIQVVVTRQNNRPASLFLQALSKLNESSLAVTVLPYRLQSSPNASKIYTMESGDITPPDSLTSAPPTYSFVLRQMAIRRRPRFMGTFFPSPSFVQHAPPPTYTGAFDIYIEPTLPAPPVRVYNFGFSSMPVVCTECGFTGMTLVQSHITICTHLCAATLCVLCCWFCVPLPYILSSCKDVYHYCRNCRSFLGMYCPTNPETPYTSVF